MTSLDACLDELQAAGFVVIPREVLGFTAEETAVVHDAQLAELDHRYKGWREDEAEAHVKKSLQGGFLGVQLLPELLALEFDARVETLARAIFTRLQGSPYHDEVLVWLERSNISFAQPLRARMAQGGALPHIDANPWAEHPMDVNRPYDKERWEPKVRVAGLHDIRPMEKDRPVQAFLALTDCAGGPNAGGMGCSRDRGFYEYLRTKTPPHGRNGHWGKLTRVYPKPGGQKLKSLSKEAQGAINDAHAKALEAIEYPPYRAGDVVVWLRETLHAGPKDNTSGVHSARMYLGMLPNNPLNRHAVGRQWAKLQDGKQAHGRACDRSEKVEGLHTLLTAGQRWRAGEFGAAEVAAGGGSSDPRAASDGQSSHSTSNNTVPRDIDLFDLPVGTTGLGFKNATAIVNLKVPLSDNLPAGTRTFVKLGEAPDDARFAETCSRLRAELGMTSTHAHIVWCSPTIDWAELAGRANPKWANGVRKRLAKAMSESSRQGQLPAFVTRAFEGIMVSEAPVQVLATTPGAGFELLRVLLFRKCVHATVARRHSHLMWHDHSRSYPHKQQPTLNLRYLGIADTNGRNMMVSGLGADDGNGAGSSSADGPVTGVQILSVDENPSSTGQLAASAGPSLQTAQTIHSSVMGAVSAAITEHPEAVAGFIRALRGLELPLSVTVGGRLAAVHAAAPFDDTTLGVLDAGGQQPELKSLAEQLSRNPRRPVTGVKRKR
mmetsp:Transcript_55327/g.152317  ORF Transcript_55327/g.152317 Transcript_55327/m.152317 type:complete len:719 (-) Transcript_55327:812-2968(-)